MLILNKTAKVPKKKKRNKIYTRFVSTAAFFVYASISEWVGRYPSGKMFVGNPKDCCCIDDV